MNDNNFERKPNSIVIFRNSKIKHDKSPIFFGKITDENGVTKDLTLWEHISKSGYKYYSGNVKDEYVKPEGDKKAASSSEKSAASKAPAKASAPAEQDDQLDDLPF